MTESIQNLIRLTDAYNQRAGQTISYKTDEPMSRHTTFRVGGIADLYMIPENRESLIALCKMIGETGVRAYFLGNGSNVLFDDAGFRGAVVSLSSLRRIEVSGTTITAEAGTTLAALTKTARDASLTGLEFAYGIPGSVGGAVTMNAGAYGGEIACVLQESTYLDPADFTVHTIPASEHNYSYRESVYKHTNRVILCAAFQLKEGNRDEIAAQMEDFMNRRVTKQPLEYPSAGSVFKRYPGRYTGQMIEEAGLKGYTIGGAQVSEKHAGFIINIGSASSKDILELIEHIKKVILDKFGCALECEILHVK
ncbi:MAG: UDP-N-acetylmuramate dehydrogenase [Clostridia bacterium]|nr:UDP-N-acetylmuramate dehydrogenase [Clostridia bacterium]